MADQTTAFVTDAQAQTIVATSGLNNRGPWEPGVSYNPRDAVIFDNAYYQCLLLNVDKPPITSPTQWLLLVFVTNGTATHTADEAYDLAGQAFAIAISGTNGVNSAEDLAYVALQTAWIGTNAASVANSNAGAARLLAVSAGSLAFTALTTAWAGTNAASVANDLASVALETAWLGTTSYAIEDWDNTLHIDMDGDDYQIFPIRDDTTIIIDNFGLLKKVTAVFIGEAGSRCDFTWNPTDISWFGPDPEDHLDTGHRAMIEITTFGQYGSEIHATYAQSN